MQNVYDLAHELSRSLQETDQYKDYLAAKEKIDADPRLKEMVLDVQTKSMALQAKQMSGEQLDPDTMVSYQQIYAAVMSDPDCANFIQKQMVLGQIVQELLGIVSEGLKFE